MRHEINNTDNNYLSTWPLLYSDQYLHETYDYQPV